MKLKNNARNRVLDLLKERDISVDSVNLPLLTFMYLQGKKDLLSFQINQLLNK